MRRLNPVRAGLVRSAGAWRWSTFQATCGETERPAFLEVEWTLENFQSKRAAAGEAYRQFVSDGKGTADPFEKASGKLFLGSPAFLDEIKKRLEGRTLSAEIPRAQRQTACAPLPGPDQRRRR